MVACARGAVNCARVLLNFSDLEAQCTGQERAGSCIDQVGWRALHYAVYKKHIDVVRLLLANGVDTDAKTVRKSTGTAYAGK